MSKITRNEYLEWILTHEDQEYEIVKENDDLYHLETKYGTASIHFMDLEEGMSLVEFTIVQKKDESVKYYLHFQILDEDHAKEMYREMVKALLDLKNDSSMRILLSCSAGLTTAMFAENLNSSAELLGLDYHFDAVSHTEIFGVANNYDAILIAPQIGYMRKRIQEALPFKPVMMIPVPVFASYDTGKCIAFVNDEIAKFREEKKKEEEKKSTCCSNCGKGRILSIAVMPNLAQTRIYYRLYENGTVFHSNYVIKPSTNWNDVDNIIDTCLARYHKPDMIGVSVPGTADANGAVTNGFSRAHNYKAYLEKKYDIPVMVNNNADAAAVGFLMEHDEYKSIIFHSQPFGYSIGDQGIIVDGKRIFGKEGLAGGVQYYLRRMQMSDDPGKLIWETEGVLELVTKGLLPAIALIGPEAVVIRSPMTPDMNEVKKKLASFIPEKYLPEFYHVQEASPYIMDGQMKICLDAMHEENEE